MSTGEVDDLASMSIREQTSARFASYRPRSGGIVRAVPTWAGHVLLADGIEPRRAHARGSRP